MNTSISKEKLLDIIAKGENQTVEIKSAGVKNVDIAREVPQRQSG